MPTAAPWKQQQTTGTTAPFAAPAPSAPSPEEQRADRLRKMALAAMQKVDGDAGAGDLYGDNVTLGLQRPVGGVAAALGGELGEWFGGEPATFGERYLAQTGAYDDRLKQAEEASGWRGTAAKLAGSVTAPVGAARSAVSNIASAAGLGFVEGAARNSDDLGQAIGGGIVGGTTSGLTSAAITGLTRGAQELVPSWRARRQAERLAARGTPPDQLRSQASSLYNQLDQAGVAYDNVQTVDLVDDLVSNLRQAGYSPRGVHSPVADVVSRIEELRGQPVSLNTLQQLRSELGSAANSIEPEVRRIAGDAMASIDGFVTHMDPAMSQIPGDQVAPIWREARRLWRTANTAEDIGWRLDKAQRRADSTNSGQNVENAIRQNIRAPLDKATQPRRRNPYSPAEIDQMGRVVEGTTAQNAVRWVGNQAAGFPSLLAGYSGIASGMDPVTSIGLTGAMVGAGHGLKRWSADMAENEADALMRLISTGSTAVPPAAVSPRDALVREMTQRMQRGTGLMVGGETTR